MIMPHPHAPLTLAEQVVAAELGYYRQLEQCIITEADLTAWQHKKEVFYTEPVAMGVSYSFACHVLERHQCSLHTYMARQLSVEAWAYWFLQGGILAPHQ